MRYIIVTSETDAEAAGQERPGGEGDSQAEESEGEAAAQQGEAEVLQRRGSKRANIEASGGDSGGDGGNEEGSDSKRTRGEATTATGGVLGGMRWAIGAMWGAAKRTVTGVVNAVMDQGSGGGTKRARQDEEEEPAGEGQRKKAKIGDG